MDSIISIIIWYSVFLISVVLHEAAHAWVALRGGDPTAYLGGQVSLNPIPHIKRAPVGTLVVPLLSFFFLYNERFMIGWASAPYNPVWSRLYPHRSARMALAGPIANILLMLLAFGALKLGVSSGWWQATTSGVGLDGLVVADGFLGLIARLLSVLFSLNLILAMINLIPAPPFDGSAVIMLFMSPTLARKYQAQLHNPVLLVIALVLVWNLFGFIFQPTIQFFRGLLS